MTTLHPIPVHLGFRLATGSAWLLVVYSLFFQQLFNMLTWIIALLQSWAKVDKTIAWKDEKATTKALQKLDMLRQRNYCHCIATRIVRIALLGLNWQHVFWWHFISIVVTEIWKTGSWLAIQFAILWNYRKFQITLLCAEHFIDLTFAFCEECNDYYCKRLPYRKQQ